MDQHRKEKFYIISFDFYVRNTGRMEENLKKGREQLQFLISLIQIICNFACLLV